MKQVTVFKHDGSRCNCRSWKRVEYLMMGREISYVTINNVITFNMNKVMDYLNN